MSTPSPDSSPVEPRSDQFLVEAANRGDTAAFEALYRRYRDWTLSLAFRFSRNREDALDVLQEVFIYFLKKFPGFRLESRLTTFLYPAVRNLSLTAARKRRRMQSGEGVLEELPAAGSLDAGDPREELAGVVGRLPSGQREVLLMRFVDGMTLQEIATALEIPIGTVKSRLHSALGALREDPGCRRYFEKDP